MKKPAPKKLSLSTQSLRVLGEGELGDGAGGWFRPPITVSCPQPPPPTSNCPKTV